MVRQMGMNGGGAMTVKKSGVTFVKPESETPGGSYFLSSLDQAIPFPMRTIYTYERSDETVVDVVKQALAKVLVHYYPLAGSLAIDPAEGLFIIDCTKKSVPFVEAEADCDIESLGDIRVPNEDTTDKLIYMDPNAQTILDFPLLTAQVTRFKCGGFTLGVAINHAVADGVSGLEFINSWGEVARGVPMSAVPCHDRSLLRARVPPQIKYPYDDYVLISDVSEMESLYQQDPNISRKFTFDSDKLAALKKKAMEDGYLSSNCSTFSALAAFVWKMRSKAFNMKPHQLTKLRILVDLRSKLKEPLPNAYFGNMVTTTCCLTTAGELGEQPLSQAVDQIRKACQLVDDEYIRSRIDYIHLHRPQLSSVGTLVISSWAGLAYGCSNFGWGDPVQFGCADLARELCVFLPEVEEEGKKKGITVIMALPVTAMNTFEKLVVSHF